MPCMNCKWSEPVRDNKGQVVFGQPVRVCKRLPPTPIFAPARGGLELKSAWPTVGLQDTCGEYLPNDGAEVETAQVAFIPEQETKQ